MNISLNNDSDKSQNKAVNQALEQCPNDHEINLFHQIYFKKTCLKVINIMKKIKIN